MATTRQERNFCKAFPVSYDLRGRKRSSQRGGGTGEGPRAIGLSRWPVVKGLCFCFSMLKTPSKRKSGDKIVGGGKGTEVRL